MLKHVLVSYLEMFIGKRLWLVLRLRVSNDVAAVTAITYDCCCLYSSLFFTMFSNVSLPDCHFTWQCRSQWLWKDEHLVSENVCLRLKWKMKRKESFLSFTKIEHGVRICSVCRQSLWLLLLSCGILCVKYHCFSMELEIDCLWCLIDGVSAFRFN